MHLAVLFTFSFCGLAALIVHSYFTKGRRLTLTFFLFAFIAGMRKEAGSFLEQTVSLLDKAPFVHSNRYPETFCVVNTVTGWALAFYLSWYLAEKITDRFVWLRKRVFPTLLVAAVAVAALAYAVEATAVNIGWWKWRFFDDKFPGFLVGGVHFFALNA